MKTNPTTRIFWIVAFAVALIALGSFAWSFMALKALAADNGAPGSLGWIWPLIVDTSMLIYTAAILVAQLQQRGAKLPTALTIFYSVVTITGNILHAPPTALGWFVAALPPLSLIFGAEMLRTMSHHIILQRGALAGLQALQAQTREAAAGLQQIERQIERKTVQLDRLNDDIKAAKSDNIKKMQQKAQQKRQAKIETRRAEVLQLLQSGNSDKQIAATLGRDVRTIRADIKALNGAAAQGVQ